MISNSDIIEGKSAYPYITHFKTEPFRSFLTIKKKDIGFFYLKNYDRVLESYRLYGNKLFSSSNVNLEHIYWFLLFRKYLKIEENKNAEEIFNFLKKCEVYQSNELGFKLYPSSRKEPDVWSTYFAVAILYLLNRLDEYMLSGEINSNKAKIKNFVLNHRKGNKFYHCFDNNCEIDKKTSPARTLFYVIQIFFLLGIDIRIYKDQFKSYIGDLKKNPSIVFKIICLKMLNLDYEVKDKDIQYLLQFQKENGGFSFKKINGKTNTTFWAVYTFHILSWLYDYNPTAIYSFINLEISQLISNYANLSFIKFMEFSRLIIILSFVWKKFILEIERVIYKSLESQSYIDVQSVINSFGLSRGIEEVISYINLSYSFNLKILDNKTEFANYLRNISSQEKVLAQAIYESLSQNNVVSLSDLIKKYNTRYRNTPVRIKDVRILLDDMMSKYFFKGKIKTKKRLVLSTKYYFLLEQILDKIIVGDKEIKVERLEEEKEKLEQIKNDLYNMTLNLKNVTKQIKEEIESYLLLNEVDYAKERLRFTLKTALMEADFLNENIENAFNEDLYYINLNAILGDEIETWKKEYSELKIKLSETETYLKEKIQEKEELIKFKLIVAELEERVFVIGEYLTKEKDVFKNFFKEQLEQEYSYDKVDLILGEINRYIEKINSYDRIIYQVSQKIVLRDQNLKDQHKQIIKNWIQIKEDSIKFFEYYNSGINFFNSIIYKTTSIRSKVDKELKELSRSIKSRVQEGNFRDARNDIKSESDSLLKKLTEEIAQIKDSVKKGIKNNKKLYFLYRHLQDIYDELEDAVISSIHAFTQQEQEKISEERNKAIIEDLDSYVSKTIQKLKANIEGYKKERQRLQSKELKEINKNFNSLREDLHKFNKKYNSKLEKCKKSIPSYDEKGSLTVIQWEKFLEYITLEIDELEEEFVNKIISTKIKSLANKSGSSNVQIKELKHELDMKCDVILEHIKNMMSISQLNGELDESEKVFVIYDDTYYKNKELRTFIENRFNKINSESIGKLLGLYDSCIKNKTLGVNFLEIQNRISDLANFEEKIRNEFYQKVRELNINISSRKDYEDTQYHFNSMLENYAQIIREIERNLTRFQKLQGLISQEFSRLNVELSNFLKTFYDETETDKSYIKISEFFERKNNKFLELFHNFQEKIEMELNETLTKDSTVSKISPEIREFYVKTKNKFILEYEERKRKGIDKLTLIKNESLRDELVEYINSQKIFVSQLLGTLQSRVEDDIEIKEFRRANSRIKRRVKNIEFESKRINKNVKSKIKEFSKEFKGFETKNRHIVENFEKFIKEFDEILKEKVKTLEKRIIKSYIDMAIKAVANEYLTVGFLNNELHIKRQNIQDSLLSLISDGSLPGKYDPRIGIYYENPEIINNLNEEELQVIKKMDFRLYMFLTRLKNFTNQYSSIIAFFASIFTISYYLFIFSGNNPFIIALPISILFVLIAYFLLKRRRKEKKGI